MFFFFYQKPLIPFKNMLTCRHKSCLSAASNHFFHCSKPVRSISSVCSSNGNSRFHISFSLVSLKRRPKLFFSTSICLNELTSHILTVAPEMPGRPRSPREPGSPRIPGAPRIPWGPGAPGGPYDMKRLFILTEKNIIFMALHNYHLICSTTISTAFQGSQCMLMLDPRNCNQAMTLNYKAK